MSDQGEFFKTPVVVVSADVLSVRCCGKTMGGSPITRAGLTCPECGAIYQVVKTDRGNDESERSGGPG